LIYALWELKEKEAVDIAKGMIQAGQDPLRVMAACKEAMDTVGKRFEKGEYFLPELVMAGEMLRQISDIVKPLLKGGLETKQLGKVIIGTVEGDIHDIGKDMVVFMLDVNGFEVIDLGIDVPVKKFVDAISKAGLRDKVKIMIGGGQIDDEVREDTGADAFGLDVMEAVSLTKKWIGGN
jgi:methanogenic corrinoid protein MtbC1